MRLESSLHTPAHRHDGLGCVRPGRNSVLQVVHSGQTGVATPVAQTEVHLMTLCFRAVRAATRPIVAAAFLLAVVAAPALAHQSSALKPSLNALKPSLNL